MPDGNNNLFELEEKKLNRIKIKIIQVEHENLKLRKTKHEMVELLRKIINDEINKRF